MILVTSGAGFIGSNFVIGWLEEMDETIINLNNLASLEEDDRHIFVKGDIDDEQLIEALLHWHKPHAIINFASESHIDEVYDSLAPDVPASAETNRFGPNSNPYSASKALSDHLTCHHTYGLSVLTTNCSNNYGPFQFLEMIPLIIHNALAHKQLPSYGDDLQTHDRPYISNHYSAIRTVLTKGVPGEVYNIGGLNEKANIEIVSTLCDILDELRPVTADASISSYRELIIYVKDRSGHNRH